MMLFAVELGPRTCEEAKPKFRGAQSKAQSTDAYTENCREWKQLAVGDLTVENNHRYGIKAQ